MKRVLRHIEAGRSSLERNEMPCLYFLLLLLWGPLALFSGFTGDEAGHDSWEEYCSFLGGDAGAFISGFLHNIGTAITYNGTQCCSFFVTRCIETYLMKKSSDNEVRSHIVFIQSLRTAARIIRRMPMEVCKHFFINNQMPQAAFFQYLQSQVGDDIKKLGDFYSRPEENKALAAMAQL